MPRKKYFFWNATPVVDSGGGNPAPTPAAPTHLSAVINAAGTSLTLTFSESMDIGPGGSGGFLLNPSGADVTLNYASGNGSSVFVYTISRAILSSETAVLDYTQPGAGLFSDDTGQSLGTFSSHAVTNNATPPALIGTPVDLLLDFEVGTTGNLISAANIASMVKGETGGTWTVKTLGGSDPATHTYISSVNKPRRTPLAVGGVDYDGAGSRGLRFNMNEDADWDQVKWVPPVDTVTGNISLTAQVRLNGAFAVDLQTIDLINLAPFCVMEEAISFNGVTHWVYPHTSLGGNSTNGWALDVEFNHWYSITLRLNSVDGYAELVILDSVTGALIGCSRAQSDQNFSFLFLSDYLSHIGGGTQYLDNVALAWAGNAALPLEPFTMPAAESLAVVQTINDRIDVSWNYGKAFTFKLERKVGSGSFATLFENLAHTLGNNVYLDTDVVNAETYTYRVTAKINEHIASPTTSDPITVANTAGGTPNLINENFEGTGAPTGWFAGGTADFDYASPAINGAQSLRTTPTDYTNVQLSGSNESEVWAKCRLRIKTMPASSARCLQLLQDDFSTIVGSIFIFANGSATTDFVNSSAAGSWAININYYVWFHFKAGIVYEIWWDTVNDRDTAGNYLTTAGNASPAFLMLFNAPDSSDLIFDDVQIGNSGDFQ